MGTAGSDEGAGPPRAPRSPRVEVKARALSALAPLALSLLAAAPAFAAGPQIAETWVTGVTATSADLRAKIDPEGASTSYRFEYLSQAAFEANLAAGREGFAGASSAPPSGAAGLGGGSVAVAVTQNVGALEPQTTYRYRVRASSTAATNYGEEHLLSTAAPTNVFPPIDGRLPELVSPPDKDGGSLGAPESIFGGGDFQAAAAGGAFTFSSTSSFGPAAGAPPASQYLAIRGGTGWTTQNLSAVLESGGYGARPDGVPFRVFSADLARALMLDGLRCGAAGTCPPRYSLWDGGSFADLPTVEGLHLAGATADLGHAVFEAQSGLYEWSGGGLETLSAEPGAALAAPVGAISEDGSRVYFTSGGDLYLREGASVVQVDSLQGGGGEFQAASTDGSVAFFLKERHLYRYLAGAGASDITPSGGVVGVLGISAAGDVAYLQDAAGLERWRGGVLSTLVPGAIASPSDYPPARATARISADGEHLAFLSSAAIAPFDNTDAETGDPDTELYIYGPPPGGGTPRLLCASCNPTGERPSGSASIPGTIRNGSDALYRPRVLSAGGNRVFFDTADRLVVPDTDGRPDVYEWEASGVGDCVRAPGCVGLISGGRGEGGRFLDASESGEDAFFLTGESLVGLDPGSIDAYDDRVGGGFREPEAPFVCKGDACQALPSPPEDPGPATLVPTSGNPPPKVEKLKKPRVCPKGKVRRNGFCMRRIHHRHGRHHHRGHR
jgi:hypothetical protein